MKTNEANNQQTITTMQDELTIVRSEFATANLKQAVNLLTPKGAKLNTLIAPSFAGQICIATLKGNEENPYYQLTIIPNICKDNRPLSIVQHLLSYLYVEKHLLARVDARNVASEYNSDRLRVAHQAIKASKALTNIYKFNDAGKIVVALECDLLLKDTPLNIDNGGLSRLIGNSQEKRAKIFAVAKHTLDLMKATNLIGYVHIRLLETLQRLNAQSVQSKNNKRKNKKTV